MVGMRGALNVLDNEGICLHVLSPLQCSVFPQTLVGHHCSLKWVLPDCQSPGLAVFSYYHHTLEAGQPLGPKGRGASPR